MKPIFIIIEVIMVVLLMLGEITFTHWGGGGGGSGNVGNSSYQEIGIGGNAYINGTALTNFCYPNSINSGRGHNGDVQHSTSSYDYGGYGGNGGCGGGCGYERYDYNASSGFQGGGIGYFSDGGYINGASARGGDENTYSDSSHNSVNSMARSPKGYFVGGNGGGHPYNVSSGGAGGFLGGTGASAQRGNGGNGGYSPYGFGGNGGEAINGSVSTYGGKGGDGKLFGGYGGNGRYESRGGNGGNGYYPGRGGISANGVNGTNGIAITNNRLVGTAPLVGMTPTTSIVIIEYGDSPEDF